MNTPTVADAEQSPAAVEDLPDRLYQLRTPGALKPAVTLGLGLPAHVGGMPAFYYWKDAILVGTYHHPAGRFSLSVTREKLDRLVSAFGRMRANGVKVPILMDHAPTAAAALGWIVDVKRRGDHLMELHQFLGPSARDVGLRNQVSLGIDPAFVDGRGESYGEAIVHSAITPLPVVPGQAGYEPLEEAATEAADAPLTLSLVEATAPEPPAEVAPKVEPPEPPAAATPVAADAPEPTDPSPTSVPAATSPPPPASPLPVVATPMLSMDAAAKRDAAVAHGCLSPAAADELVALLSAAAPLGSTLMLSTNPPAGDLASAIFATLARHRPPSLGERTAVQLLTRLIPGQDDDRLELRDRMIALASGR